PTCQIVGEPDSRTRCTLDSQFGSEPDAAPPLPPAFSAWPIGSPATLERSRSVIGPGFGTPIECRCLDLCHARAVLCQGVESRKRKSITPWPPRRSATGTTRSDAQGGRSYLRGKTDKVRPNALRPTGHRRHS